MYIRTTIYHIGWLFPGYGSKVFKFYPLRIIHHNLCIFRKGDGRKAYIHEPVRRVFKTIDVDYRFYRGSPRKVNVPEYKLTEGGQFRRRVTVVVIIQRRKNSDLQQVAIGHSNILYIAAPVFGTLDLHAMQQGACPAILHQYIAYATRHFAADGDAMSPDKITIGNPDIHGGFG